MFERPYAHLTSVERSLRIGSVTQSMMTKKYLPFAHTAGHMASMVPFRRAIHAPCSDYISHGRGTK